jgi:2,4-dienoyl-CoA reductase-like NADH-dependent reductase (Old Yellow Enzyme family)
MRAVHSTAACGPHAPSWNGKSPLNGEDVRLRGEPPWPIIGPTATPASGMPVPSALGAEEILAIIDKWVAAARRALDAGFEVLEIYATHGYLVHQFLSPLSNERADQYGGDQAGRMRFALEVVEAVRSV